MVSPVGDKFFVEATAGRLFLFCKACVIHHTIFAFFKPCRGRYFAVPQNRFALCGFYVVQETTKAVQVLFFDTYLFSDLVCISFFHLCTA